jgi:hypothetical protein
MSIKASISPRNASLQVAISSPNRTVIADPRFKPKPNVALIELSDTEVINPEEGDVVAFDATEGKFTNQRLGDIAAIPTNINGGRF